MITSRKIDRFDEFLHLEPAWNDLLSRSDSDVPFLTFEWIKAWWLSFGKKKKLFIILVEDEAKRLIGIAPLMIVRENYKCFPARVLKFIRDDNASHVNCIICDRYPEVFENIFECVNKFKKTWDLCVLDAIIEHLPSFKYMKEYVRRANVRHIIHRQHKSPYIVIASSRDSFLEKLSHKSRKTLRNEINRIKKIGDLQISETTCASNLDDVLDDVAEVSRLSWKGTIRGDVECNPENKKFFRLLSHEMHKKTWLSIWQLKVNGKTIAMEYHINYKNKIYALRGDYDCAYGSCSPGAVLDNYIVQNIFERNIDEYDMCGDAYPYKLAWTHDSRDHQSITIYNRSIYADFLHFVEKNVVPLIRVVKRAVRRKIMYPQKVVG
jgi:CelD/BcsL family acetyltransferase involved in cellulose biosynthesis